LADSSGHLLALVSAAVVLRQERWQVAVVGVARLPVGAGVRPRAAAAAPLTWRQLDVQNPAARGAGRVAAQPFVDAGGVESVAALGQHAHGLAVLELGEADGALRRRGLRLRLASVAREGRRDVRDGGDRAEHRLLDAPVGCGRLRLRRAAAPARAPRDEADGEDADEHAEERGEDDDDVVVVGGARRRRRRL
jgi:hypothetical protein